MLGLSGFEIYSLWVPLTFHFKTKVNVKILHLYLVQLKQVAKDYLMESRECQGAFTPRFPCNGTLFQLVVSRCSLLFFLITLMAEIYNDTHPLVAPLV